MNFGDVGEFKLEAMVASDGAAPVYEMLFRPSNDGGFPRTRDGWRRWYEHLPERIGSLMDRDIIDGDVSINLDTWQVLDRGISSVIEAMAEMDLARSVILEWTERMEDVARTEAAAQRLVQWRKRYGFRLALDDIGFPEAPRRDDFLKADMVKIDGAFFHRAVQHPIAERLVKQHVSQFKEHGATLVFEWIESERHEKHARALGADLTQGFYWGERYAIPLPEGLVKGTAPPIALAM